MLLKVSFPFGPDLEVQYFLRGTILFLFFFSFLFSTCQHCITLRYCSIACFVLYIYVVNNILHAVHVVTEVDIFVV